MMNNLANIFRWGKSHGKNHGGGGVGTGPSTMDPLPGLPPPGGPPQEVSLFYSFKKPAYFKTSY